MPLKRNRVLESDTEIDKQWTDNKVLTLCTSNVQDYRGWKTASTSNYSMGKNNPFQQLAHSAKQ
jgi:hypothetical protein